jgi:hypothetical protein
MTIKLNEEIAVLKNEMINIKETSEETKKQNTAEHLDIKTQLRAIVVKLDEAVMCKADKEDLRSLDNRFWGIVVGMLFLLAGIIAAWFK